jgi:hypothetical protein
MPVFEQGAHGHFLLLLHACCCVAKAGGSTDCSLKAALSEFVTQLVLTMMVNNQVIYTVRLSGKVIEPNEK